MPKVKAKFLLEQSETNFVYGGIAIVLFVEFFILVMVYLKTLSTTFLIPTAIVDIFFGYIFLNETFKGKKKLEKIKEIELIKEIMQERKKWKQVYINFGNN